MTDSDVMTLEEVAAYLKVTPQTIYTSGSGEADPAQSSGRSGGSRGPSSTDGSTDILILASNLWWRDPVGAGNETEGVERGWENRFVRSDREESLFQKQHRAGLCK